MTLRQFILETLTIFLGDVLATAFIAIVVYVVWYILKYPGFRVGASWSFKGWSVKQRGRFPSESDTEPMVLTPNVSISSYDTSVKKLVHSIWVRERADIYNPGEILGHLDLQRSFVAVEQRTTGGDVINLHGPSINCVASQFHKIVNFPVFVQTSDGTFYRAESVGNTATGILRLRYRARNTLYKIKQQFFALKLFIQRRIGRQK